MTKKYNFEMELMDPTNEFQEGWPIHRRYFEVFDKVFPRENYKHLHDLVESLYGRTTVAMAAMDKKMRDELGDHY